MAEPAQKFDDPPDDIYDEPSGTAASDPTPRLKALEGQGEGDGVPQGNLKVADQDNPDNKELAEAEEKHDSSSNSADDFVKSKSEEPKSESFYKPHAKSKQGFIGNLNDSRNLKKYLIIGGFGAALVAVVILLFSFLNVFKLDGLMSSIEQRAFLRTNATLDTRSSKWINAYVTARLMDMGDNPNFDNPDYTKDDNLLFRSERVDNNRPFTDWYRTLRTSNFEQDVFEKHGIKFTSMVTADGKFRTGQISIAGEKPIPMKVSEMTDVDFNKLAQGDIPTIRKFGDVVDTTVFENNKEARKAIRRVVKENTRWDQVYKRRALRKDIQNMTGVKDWRFFENSRDNLAQKRIDVRNKIIDKMVPDTNLLGQVTKCLFGISECKPNRDVAAPQNKFTTAQLAGVDKPDPNTPEEQKTEVALAKNLDAAGISELLKKILDAANIFTRILNIPSTLDMLSNIDKSVSDLVKFIVIARGAQAAGLFQVFETSRDQLKTGEVTSQEVNDLMNVVSTAGSSDAQVKVIDGQGDPSVASTDVRCTQKARALYDKDPGAYDKQYGTFAPLCADQRIGSAANGQMIQESYNTTIGPVVHPIVAAWGGIKSIPVIGQAIDLITKFSNLISGITDAIVKEVLTTLGLQDNLEQAMTWVFGKVASFLGLSILTGKELPGTFYNWLVQGGSYTAESAARQQGASITNNASQAAAQGVIAQYQKNKQESTTMYERVASLSNSDSLAYRGAYALSNVKSDPSTALMSAFSSMWHAAGKNFSMAFGGHTNAATPNGYTASKFAGIETYDYPQKCYDLDPLVNRGAINGTNALDVFRENNITVSAANLTLLNDWDTESDSDAFYEVIYDILNDSPFANNADDIAIKIYNCNLLDNAVSGSLGYIYGYTNDHADLAQ